MNTGTSVPINPSWREMDFALQTITESSDRMPSSDSQSGGSAYFTPLDFKSFGPQGGGGYVTGVGGGGHEKKGYTFRNQVTGSMFEWNPPIPRAFGSAWRR